MDHAELLVTGMSCTYCPSDNHLLLSQGSNVPLVVKWADTEKERQARKAQKAQSRASTAASADPSPHSSLFGAMPMGYLPPYNGYGYQVCFLSSIVKSFPGTPSNDASVMPVLHRHGRKLPCHHSQYLACKVWAFWTLAYLYSLSREFFFWAL